MNYSFHEKNSSNLEKGIFNYTLKEAEQRKIVKKWDNKPFVQIYIDRLKSILTNLNDQLIENVNNTGGVVPHNHRHHGKHHGHWYY